MLGSLAVFCGLLVACGTRVSIGELAEPTLPSLGEPEAPSATFPIDGDLDDADSPMQGDFDANLSSDAPVEASKPPLRVNALDGGVSDAGWTPCRGKVCGDSCRICPPTDFHCIETAVLKSCNAAGECTPGVSICDGGT